jgi:hypothetical protein
MRYNIACYVGLSLPDQSAALWGQVKVIVFVGEINQKLSNLCIVFCAKTTKLSLLKAFAKENFVVM